MSLEEQEAKEAIASEFQKAAADVGEKHPEVATVLSFHQDVMVEAMRRIRALEADVKRLRDQTGWE